MGTCLLLLNRSLPDSCWRIRRYPGITCKSPLTSASRGLPLAEATGELSWKRKTKPPSRGISQSSRKRLLQPRRTLQVAALPCHQQKEKPRDGTLLPVNPSEPFGSRTHFPRPRGRVKSVGVSVLAAPKDKLLSPRWKWDPGKWDPCDLQAAIVSYCSWHFCSCTVSRPGPLADWGKPAGRQPRKRRAR